MTEAEWSSWTGEPDAMLNLVRKNVSERKLRLFACACCRRILHLLPDERSRKAVEVGELFADGLVKEQELNAARVAAGAAHFEAASPEIFSPAAHGAACAAFTVAAFAIYTFAAANRAAACRGPGKETEQKEQSALFREIIGNPYRRRCVDPCFQAPNVAKLAQNIYDDRAFDRMPVLADALVDAGCTDFDILAHCLQPGPHVRGCWVVDLLLSKE